RNHKLLDTVMVRRLKQDLREIGEEFPQRFVSPIVIDHLPEDAPELKLSQLLQQYRSLREERLKDAAKSTQTTAMLVITSLQKRLLSSIEAFARTLKVHRTAVEKQAANRPAIHKVSLPLLLESVSADDERAEFLEAEIEAEEDAQMAAATMQAAGQTARELAILDEMADVANSSRYQPDPRIHKLVEWIRQNLCPQLGEANAAWLERRVIIFTEYTDTKRYLQQQLQSAIANSHREHERIEVFHGGMGEERREAIKSAFNADPARHPLRILIATDAAREGVNLQNNCADLFHFDVPWNPSRMEQRNGRIDRKLQRSPVVHCYYFVLPQRTEDKVLAVLVRKTATIQQELGSLAPVVERNMSRLLAHGIRHQDVSNLTSSINQAEQINDQEIVSTQVSQSVAGVRPASPLGAGSGVINEELEQARVRQQDLTKQVENLQAMLKNSRDWLGLDDHHFRDAISASLEILGVPSLTPVDVNEVANNPVTARWTIPALDQQTGADPTWSTTIDTLRTPRKIGQKPWEWRKEAPIRPVVFRDPGSLDGDVVHLHLEHRIVQRLLSRFLSQGFLHDELTRACVCLTNDPMPKVIALGRLALYGERAARLHDQVIAVAAEWLDPTSRGRKKLQPLKEGEKDNVLELLETSLASPHLLEVASAVKERLQKSAAEDVGELIPHLERRAEILAESAKKKLVNRGIKEAAEMKKILEEQQTRILNCQKDSQAVQLSLPIIEEQRQVDADRRHWEKRLKAIALELISEPARIEAAYQVKAVRVEPVGVIYLWPISG
ncbi:MAG: helicase, partial [Dolichospermum sp.]|nr:helicase [Dolichospermum sp.]